MHHQISVYPIPLRWNNSQSVNADSDNNPSIEGTSIHRRQHFLFQFSLTNWHNNANAKSDLNSLNGKSINITATEPKTFNGHSVRIFILERSDEDKKSNHGRYNGIEQLKEICVRRYVHVLV